MKGLLVFLFEVFGIKVAFFIKRRLRMKCYRCGGLMVFEKFFGISEDFYGWRCLFCGEIIDKVILENRLGQKKS